ncbi:Mitochondrial 2-methylisocitrate lyase-like protein [Emericellopsis cladophorae]|uniref:methylisocitrate lyase n=1 Tax=Emericellopsis cladophorae TaxID=2686198 RepID=A0A9P9Y9I1_9HYPO|nr:Mitochondrial 2-methylisocitrate lyase-like protein [Emericellopsis cladophorae]KAI6785941.1 Mitochondrial 2-methylisocitrate lyase-like protein [Emericellopsis cladophorae]
MPQLNISLDEEQAKPYSARTVAALRNSIDVAPTASSQQVVKLWNQLQEHSKNGTTELTFGTSEPTIVSQIAEHQQSVYVSGALCGFSEVDAPGMDACDYPWDTLPKTDGSKKLSWCGGYLADAFFETNAGEEMAVKA